MSWTKVDIPINATDVRATGEPLETVIQEDRGDGAVETVQSGYVDVDGDGVPEQCVKLEVYIRPSEFNRINIRTSHDKGGECLAYYANTSANAHTLGAEVFIGSFLDNGMEQIAIIKDDELIGIFEWKAPPSDDVESD